jgi:hypothetical protein
MDQGDDGFLASLERLGADAVADRSAKERSQARVLRQVAKESATFAGVAVDLAERGDPIVARMATGRSHRGRVLAVGRDFVVVRDATGPPVLLATTAIASLRPQLHGPLDTTGARRPPLDVGLAVLLAGLAADRPRVQVMAVGDHQPLAGELRAVGLDVATIRLDGEARNLAHVRIANLAEVVLIDHE